MLELGRIWRICLECAAIFGHLPLTVRCRLGDYTRAMMIKRLLTICAAVTAGAAGTTLSLAHGLPVMSRAGSFAAPPPSLPPSPARGLTAEVCPRFPRSVLD